MLCRVASVLIRRARVDEGALIAAVQAQSWRETYAKELSPESLDRLAVDAATWNRRLQEAGSLKSRRSIWVAELDDRVVGFAAVGPDPDEDGTGRLYAIYVLAEAQGTGVGRRLHQSALAALRDAGFTEATLWVLASNAAAIRFYELADWRRDGGARTEDFDGVPLRELRYRVQLSDRRG